MIIDKLYTLAWGSRAEVGRVTVAFSWPKESFADVGSWKLEPVNLQWLCGLAVKPCSYAYSFISLDGPYYIYNNNNIYILERGSRSPKKNCRHSCMAWPPSHKVIAGLRTRVFNCQRLRMTPSAKRMPPSPAHYLHNTWLGRNII